jgi:ribosomal protein L32
MTRKAKCHECNISMKRIADCESSPEGICGVHKCPNCGKVIHSHRGSKQLIEGLK